MLFRNTMILVLLVVWLLCGWVRSQQDSSSLDDRDRRANLRKRMLERLALRGYEVRERERVAEELLARLESHLTSSSISTPPTRRLQRDHHRSLQRHNSRIFQHGPYGEVIAPIYEGQLYPQIEVMSEIDIPPMEEEEEEEAEIERVSVELEETKDVLRQYLIGEILPDKTMGRRHVDEEIVLEQTTRRSPREERRREKEDKKRKKETKKRKRNNKKNKQRKKDQEFELLLKSQNITIHDGADGEKFFDCCPSETVLVNMSVGKDKNHLAVDISADHRIFVEQVCLEEYLDKTCIFPAKSLRKGVVTRCAQEYSFSQALIRPFGDPLVPYMIGHIKVKSGCSCQVSLTHKKKRKRKR